MGLQNARQTQRRDTAAIFWGRPSAADGSVAFCAALRGICSINRGGQVGVHEEPRTIVSARCLIRSAREGICLAPLTRSRMY